MAVVSHFFIFLAPEPFASATVSREICFLWSSCSKTLEDENRTFCCLTEGDETTAPCKTEATPALGVVNTDGVTQGTMTRAP